MKSLALRGTALDIAIAVGAAVVAAVTIVTGLPSDRPAAQWALAEASAVAVVLMRHAPLLVLGLEVVLVVAADALLPAGSHVAPLAAGIALGAVAYRHGGPVIAAGWAVTLAAVLFTVARDGGGLLTGPDGVVRILSTAAAVAAPVAFGRYLAGVRHAAAEAEERALVEREAARLAERARISGDLHDLVAHHVSAIALRAGSARYAARHGDPSPARLEEAASALDAIHASARQALVDLRGLLHVLRDPGSADPLADPEKMITDAVERSRSAGLGVRADVDERTSAARSRCGSPPPAWCRRR